MEDYLGRNLVGIMEISKIIDDVNVFCNRPRNGEVDTKRTVRCIQRLSKHEKLPGIGYKNSWKVKNSKFVEP